MNTKIAYTIRFKTKNISYLSQVGNLIVSLILSITWKSFLKTFQKFM